MNPRYRKIAVFAGAAVLAGGVGVAVASQGGEDTGSRAALTQGMPGQPGAGQAQGTVPGQSGQTQGGQSQGAVPGGPPGAGGPGALDLETLAGKLGVSTDDLEAALQDLLPEPPTESGENPLVTALAGALGLADDTVAAALEAVRPDDDFHGGAPPAGATPPSGGDTAPPSGAAPDGSDDGSTPPSGSDDGTTAQTALS